jgi:hypothetical protein
VRLSRQCITCGLPEEAHKWVTWEEYEKTEKIESLNFCDVMTKGKALFLVPRSFEVAIENPCDEEYMNEISGCG